MTSNTANPTKTNLAILTIAAVALLAHHKWVYLGHFGIDDMGYAAIAQNWANGHFVMANDHYAYRWGLLWPLSLSYRLFGVNDHSSALPAMLATLLTLWLLLKTLDIHFGWQGKTLAAIMFVGNPITLFYSDKLMPDCYVAFAVMLCFWIIHRFRYIAHFQYSIVYAAAFSVSVVYGFICKETMVLLLPVFLFMMVADWRQIQARRFWMASILWGGLAFVLYFGIIALMTGNPLQRFVALEAGAYFNPCSYEQLPWSAVMRRVGYELWFAFIQNGMILVISVSLLGGIAFWSKKEFWQMRQVSYFWAVVGLVSLLSAVYSSVTPFHYVPMCPDPRHFMYLMPLFAVATPFVLRERFERRGFWISLASGMLCFAFLSFYNAWEHVPLFYALGLAAALVATYLVVQDLARFRIVGLLVLGFLFSIKIYYSYLYAHQVNFTNQQKVVKGFFKDLKMPVRVISDQVQCNLGAYAMSFDSTFVRFYNHSDANFLYKKESQPHYYIENGFTLYLSGMDWNTLPEWAKNPRGNGLELVASENGVTIWRMNF